MQGLKIRAGESLDSGVGLRAGWLRVQDVSHSI